ncbi:hypothetical protein EMIT048CA2_280026 [Pseudomonas chlororaphis]
MRAPSAAFHRQGSRRLHSKRQGAGPVESRAHRRHVRASPADPGKPQPPDRRCGPASDRRPGRRGGDRGQAHVHDDARCGEAELVDDHLGDAGRIPRKRGDPQRVSQPDQVIGCPKEPAFIAGFFRLAKIR